jgi:ribosome-binding factor A
MRSQDFSRVRRVSDQIAREVASLLLSEVSDPRVRGVTVSGVDLSPDMRNAVIFVSCPRDSDPNDVLRGLAKAGPFIRRQLAHQVRMKYLPQLRFEHDPSLNQVDRIERLLKDARDGEG